MLSNQSVKQKSLSGSGWLTRQGRKLAEISYELVLSEHFIILCGMEGSQVVPAGSEINGEIKVDGDLIPNNQDHALGVLLEDQQEYLIDRIKPGREPGTLIVRLCF